MRQERPLKLILNEITKKDEARNFLKPIFARGETDPDKVVPAMVHKLKIANNTAVTYFHMIAKELKVKREDEKTQMGGMSDEDADIDADSGDEDEDNDDGFDKIGNFDTDEDGNLVDVDPDDLGDGEFVKFDDPDRQGIIRSVPAAKLVYKRENSQGLYDELWIFNINTIADKEVDIKQDILAGTDIPPRSTKSEDGIQSYTLTTIGNAQLLRVSNLPQ